MLLLAATINSIHNDRGERAMRRALNIAHGPTRANFHVYENR